MNLIDQSVSLNHETVKMCELVISKLKSPTISRNPGSVIVYSKSDENSHRKSVLLDLFLDDSGGL